MSRKDVSVGDIVLFVIKPNSKSNVIDAIEQGEYDQGYWEILEIIESGMSSTQMKEINNCIPSNDETVYGPSPHIACKFLNNGACELISINDDPEFEIIEVISSKDFNLGEKIGR